MRLHRKVPLQEGEDIVLLDLEGLDVTANGEHLCHRGPPAFGGRQRFDQVVASGGLVGLEESVPAEPKSKRA